MAYRTDGQCERFDSLRLELMLARIDKAVCRPTYCMKKGWPSALLAYSEVIHLAFL